MVSPGQGKLLLSNLSGLPSQRSRFLKLDAFYLVAVLFSWTLFQLSGCSRKCSWEMTSYNIAHLDGRLFEAFRLPVTFIGNS